MLYRCAWCWRRADDAQVAGVVNNRFDHLDIQLSVSPAAMGSPAGRTGPPHSVTVPHRSQRGSQLPAGEVLEVGHRYTRSRQAGMNSHLNQMDWVSVESVGAEQTSARHEHRGRSDSVV
jgi:hypothetical protein